MSKERKTYSKEFKQKAVELSNVRGNVQEIARELGIAAEYIYRWRKAQKLNPNLAFGGRGKAQLTPEQQELARLKKELADVQMERDILKKAVSIFSTSDRKSINSWETIKRNIRLGRCVKSLEWVVAAIIKPKVIYHQDEMEKMAFCYQRSAEYTSRVRQLTGAHEWQKNLIPGVTKPPGHELLD